MDNSSADRLWVEKRVNGQWIHIPNGLLGIVPGDHFRMLVNEGDEVPVLEATADGIPSMYLNEGGTVCGSVVCVSDDGFSENYRPIM